MEPGQPALYSPARYQRAGTAASNKRPAARSASAGKHAIAAFKRRRQRDARHPSARLISPRRGRVHTLPTRTPHESAVLQTRNGRGHGARRQVGKLGEVAAARTPVDPAPETASTVRSFLAATARLVGRQLLRSHVRLPIRPADLFRQLPLHGLRNGRDYKGFPPAESLKTGGRRDIR